MLGRNNFGRPKANERVGRLKFGKPGKGIGPRDGSFNDGIANGGGKGIDGNPNLGNDGRFGILKLKPLGKEIEILGSDGKLRLGMLKLGGKGIFGKLKLGSPGRPGNPSENPKPILGRTRSGRTGKPGKFKPGITSDGGKGISGRPGIGIRAG